MKTSTHFRTRIYATYASVSGLNKPLRSKELSLRRNFAAHLKKLNGKILDIGSGQGEMLELCKTLGLVGRGIDVSPELVADCNRRGLDVTYVVDLQSYLQACHQEFAAVSMIDVLEHLTREEALETLSLVRSQSLQPGGSILIQVPNMQSPWANLNHYHDLTHEWGYTQASLNQLLRAAGFGAAQFFPQQYPATVSYLLRSLLRSGYYAITRACLLIDQPNRGRILTPNIIAIAVASPGNGT